MQEHEVPTHLQAKDRIFLGLTFQELVILMAVAGLCWGVWHFAPFASWQVRIALAIPVALTGIVGVIAKVRGRPLPVMAMDVLTYFIAPHHYQGTIADLTRDEPPALAIPKSTPIKRPTGPLGLDLSFLTFWKRRQAVKVVKVIPQAGGLNLSLGETYSTLTSEEPLDIVPAPRINRAPLNIPNPIRRLTRLLGLVVSFSMFWKRREVPDVTPQAGELNLSLGEDQSDPTPAEPLDAGPAAPNNRVAPSLAVIAFLTAALALLPNLAAADGPLGGEGWGMGEIQYIAPDPIPGRRMFLERLSITSDKVELQVRAATDLKVMIQVFGGADGRELIESSDFLTFTQGQPVATQLPLDGPSPSLRIHWKDKRTQQGSFNLAKSRIPHPLPSWQSEYCDISVTSLTWTPGSIDGSLHADCAAEGEELTSIQTHQGVIEQLVQETQLPHEILTNSGQFSIAVTNSNNPNPVVVPWSSLADTTFSIPISATSMAQPISLQMQLNTTGQALPVSHRKNHVYIPAHYITENVTVCPPGCSCSEEMARYYHPAFIRPGILSVNHPPPNSVDDLWLEIPTTLFTDTPYERLDLPPLPVGTQPRPLPNGMTVAQYLEQPQAPWVGGP